PAVIAPAVHPAGDRDVPTEERLVDLSAVVCAHRGARWYASPPGHRKAELKALRQLEHRGPLERAAAQPLEGEIRILERKALHRGLQSQPCSEREELPPVGAREVGNRGH